MRASASAAVSSSTTACCNRCGASLSGGPMAARLSGVLTPLRDVRRRPLRSGLTTGGIAIGVAALVVLGALSEKMSRLVEGGRDFATGQVTVSGAGTGALSGMMRGGLLAAEQLHALETIDGVAAVAPIVMFPAA